jgi:hypothetical protein
VLARAYSGWLSRMCPRNLGGNITRARKRIAELEAGARDDRGARRWLEARYPGACADCGAEVERGDRVLYFRRTRAVVCASCAGEVRSGP